MKVASPDPDASVRRAPPALSVPKGRVGSNFAAVPKPPISMKPCAPAGSAAPSSAAASSVDLTRVDRIVVPRRGVAASESLYSHGGGECASLRGFPKHCASPVFHETDASGARWLLA